MGSPIVNKTFSAPGFFHTQLPHRWYHEIVNLQYAVKGHNPLRGVWKEFYCWKLEKRITVHLQSLVRSLCLQMSRCSLQDTLAQGPFQGGFFQTSIWTGSSFCSYPDSYEMNATKRYAYEATAMLSWRACEYVEIEYQQNEFTIQIELQAQIQCVMSQTCPEWVWSS